MDSIESLIYGMLANNRNDVVGTDEVGNYFVDTCYTADAGYETGIRKWGGEWIIVERYSSREEAEEGHKEWMDYCMTNPTFAYSVQLDEKVRL